MKKIISFCTIVVTLIVIFFVINNTNVVIDIAGIIENKTKIDESVVHQDYYYLQLNYDEKEIYKSVYTACMNKDEEAVILFKNKIAEKSVSKAMIAFFYDYPEIFYIDTSYSYQLKETINLNVIKIDMSYCFATTQIDSKVDELNNIVDKIITDNINEKMSDYEKELAIHDYLCTNSVYFNNVDSIKHTAYGALVERSALCDGFSKAFQLIAKKCDIDTIIVAGTKDGVSHAWNIVKLLDKAYHLDVTADLYVTKDKVTVPIHAAFNFSDTEMKNGYVVDTAFDIPNCTENKYNYYVYNEIDITSSSQLQSVISRAVRNNKSKYIMEVRINNVDDPSSKYAQALYDANFNQYKTYGKTSIDYSKVLNSYIVEK